MNELALAFANSSELGFHGADPTYLTTASARRRLGNWFAFLFRIGAMFVVPACLATLFLPNRNVIGVWLMFEVAAAGLMLALSYDAWLAGVRRIALAGIWPFVHFIGGVFVARRISSILIGFVAFGASMILADWLFGSSGWAAMAISIPVTLGLAILIGHAVSVAAFILKIACDIFRYIGSRAYRETLLNRWRDQLRSLSLSREDELIIVAHSLGTVIAVEGLLTSDEGRLPRHLVLITMGCPLRRLFWRFFTPLFPSPEECARALASRVEDFRWCNVFRPLDLIGAKLTSPSITDASTAQLLKNHTNYWSDPTVWTIVTSFINHRPRSVVYAHSSTTSFWPVRSTDLNDPGLMTGIWSLRGISVAFAFLLVSCTLAWSTAQALARHQLYYSLVILNLTAGSIAAAWTNNLIESVAFAWLCYDGISYALTLSGSQPSETPVSWLRSHLGIVSGSIALLIIVAATAYGLASHPARWPKMTSTALVSSVGGLEGVDLAYAIGGSNLAFDGSDERLAFASMQAKTATYWSINKNSIHRDGEQQLEFAKAAAFDRALRIIYTDDNGALKSVDAATTVRTELDAPLTREFVDAAAVSADPPCTSVAVGFNITTRCLQQPQMTCMADGYTAHMSLSADGRTVGSIGRDGRLAILDTTTCRVSAMLPPRSIVNKSGVPGLVKLSPTGRYALAGPYSDSVRIWTRSSNTWRTLDVPNVKALETVTFSEDSKYVAVAFLNGVIAVFRTADGELLTRSEDYNLGSTVALAFGHRNDILAAVTEYQDTGAATNPIAGAVMKFVAGAGLHVWRVRLPTDKQR